jgi:hypothetical protein
VDSESGTIYNTGFFKIITGAWNIKLSGFLTGQVVAFNTAAARKPVLDLSYTNTTLTAGGYGYFGTDLSYSNSPTSTNYVYTNATAVVFKGTVTSTKYGAIK